MFRQGDVDQILAKFPEDITKLDLTYGKGKKEKGTRYKQGEVASDEWGCAWHVAEDGVAGEVKCPPISDVSEIDSLTGPYEILDGADFSRVNKMCAGMETFMELAYVSKAIYKLRDIVHEFFLEEIRRWIETDVDGILFMDDWGSQKSLLISPQLWREFFKPLYKEYCELIHSKGKYVFFHSDGRIEAIYPELIEVGIDAVNSQLFCMDMEKLAKEYKGKITFWGEIDRQHILPFGSTKDVADAVKKVKESLWMSEGGIIAQCEFGLKDPVENIETVFEAWDSIVQK